MYQLILSHISLAFVVFFFMNATVSYFTTKSIKHYQSRWHILMSSFIGIYTLFLCINIHIKDPLYSNAILQGHWISSYIALFCYLKAIEFYLNKKIKLLIYPKIVFLSISISYFISEIFYLLTNKTIFLTPLKTNLITNYSKASYLTMSASPLAIFIGYFGIAMIVFACSIIWRELTLSKNKETVLKLGIILCLITGAYDTAIGLGHLKTQLPVFYLAFALESLRFMFHHKQLATNEILKLNKEVDKLSKVAQFGIVTASISHDIKNHLQIIRTSLIILKKRYEQKYVDLAVKHTEEINNISSLYTNMFKKNLEQDVQQISISEVLNNVKELSKKKLESTHTNLEITSFEKDFTVEGNRTELTLSIVNLVNNSIDAISSKKDRWIKISVFPSLRSIQVIDSGTGIEEKYIDKLFSYEFSTKKNEGGTGLGLAIVKQILAKYKHKLSYLRGKTNTTFEISFK